MSALTDILGGELKIGVQCACRGSKYYQDCIAEISGTSHHQLSSGYAYNHSTGLYHMN